MLLLLPLLLVGGGVLCLFFSLSLSLSLFLVCVCVCVFCFFALDFASSRSRVCVSLDGVLCASVKDMNSCFFLVLS
jgi:hypothetical protein